MKKLIFLLILAVVVGGFVAALNTAHPPMALTMDAALSENDGYETAITPDTVSADMLFTEQAAGYLTVPDFYMINGLAGQPVCLPLTEPVMVTGQGVFIPPSGAGFHLRL